MNKYESLEQEAANVGAYVVEYAFKNRRIKGLYSDNVIAINSFIESSKEKACVLAEELGHHCTTSGNILDQSDVSNRKQEQIARLWAYNNQIGLAGIIRAYQNHCRNLYEMADYLEVTEEFLSDALRRYREKYGTYTTLDNYFIYFEPHLAVMELYDIE